MIAQGRLRIKRALRAFFAGSARGTYHRSPPLEHDRPKVKGGRSKQQKKRPGAWSPVSIDSRCKVWSVRPQTAEEIIRSMEVTVDYLSSGPAVEGLWGVPAFFRPADALILPRPVAMLPAFCPVGLDERFFI